MRMRIENIESFISAFDCKEVTSIELFEPSSNETHPEGLVSYEIFGTPGTPDRKSKWGWIRLNHIFIHPHVVRELFRVYTTTIFTDFMLGNVDFGITPAKDLERARDNVKYISRGTGIQWLYDNWDKIEWKDRRGCSKSTSMSRRFFKITKKNLIFIDKWLIIPAFYRDMDMRTQKRNELNKLYVSLMSSAKSIKTMVASFGEHGARSAIYRAQKLLLDIFEYFTSKITGTHGFINEHVIGKNTDYASRMVITSCNLNSSTVDDMEVDLTHCALPLHSAIKSFSPFIVFGFVSFIQNIMRGSNYCMVMTEKGRDRKELSPYWTELISKDNISKLMNRYESDRHFRLETVMIDTVDGKYPILIQNPNKEYIEHEDDDWKTLTWCELFYMIAEINIGDKHGYITRYPVEDHNSVITCKINIIPCSKYTKRYGYKFYPEVEKADSEHLDYFFSDSLRMSPLYLAGLQADFDGDVVNFQGVFTKEANEDADRHLKSLLNFVSVDGSPVRVLKDFGNISLYNLTIKPEELQDG